LTVTLIGHPKERVLPGPAVQVGSAVLVIVNVAPLIVGEI